MVKPEQHPTEYSVHTILLNHYNVGDTLEVAATITTEKTTDFFKSKYMPQKENIPVLV